GAGPNAATLTVTRTSDNSLPVEVQLTSSHPAEIELPAKVTFFPGELAKKISLTPIDDTVIDTNSNIILTLQSLETLSPNPISPGFMTNIIVLDDDGPALQLAFSRDWVCSGSGTNSPLASVAARLTRTGLSDDAVTVSLTADSVDLLNFPPTVTL